MDAKSNMGPESHESITRPSGALQKLSPRCDGAYPNLQSRLGSSGLVFEESLDVQGGENHDGTAPLLPGERMEEEETREEDGEELTRRHDGREEERSKLFDGVQNAELTAHGGQRQDKDILEYGGVVTDEVKGLGKGTVGEEPEERERGGEAVDVEHLVVRLHLITLEELVLESRGEAIESKITKHEEHALGARVRISSAVLVRHLSVQRENGAPERDAQRYEVIARLVPSLIDKVSPNHHRDHLCALTQGLYGERDVSQRFVLTRRGQHVARAHPRILPNRRHWVYHPSRVCQNNCREQSTQHSIA